MKEEKCANYERDNNELIQTDSITIKKVFDALEKVYTHGTKADDSVVESVREKLLIRSNIGINKYNTTLDSNNKDNYLNHLQQELMDGANYIEKLLRQKRDITQLVKEYPNDTDLGTIIRKVYG